MTLPTAREPLVALTHSQGALTGLPQLLEERGLAVTHTPLLQAVPRDDEETRAGAKALLQCPWLLITSRNTVNALRSLGVDLADDKAPFIGAVGPGTAAALEEMGASADLIADYFDGEGLARAFLAHPQARGPVGLPRGNRALPTLEERLREAGYEVRTVTVYDTEELAWRGPTAAVVVLASPSAVEALPAALAGSARLVAIGETTRKAIEERGWRCEVAPSATPEGVAVAVERAVRTWATQSQAVKAPAPSEAAKP